MLFNVCLWVYEYGGGVYLSIFEGMFFVNFVFGGDSSILNIVSMV